ncbi:DUF3293 domain-containing protein [Pyxidicoccus parkwayensis]|uniref:DUF3293 domain-containing protein n=1 Tax=Pyxidicoccus parkwayensis TaxID=2813578 RepID=A0ABX7NW95_9BACT|nr:DUF3293 domain-containing protein [Pyxidicoccus parkwaysis]QSQ22983.1 DUF3293 domain-containing protein [Pyxidicoccus parkwaysis]
MTDSEWEALAKAYRATRYVIRPQAFTGGHEWVLRVDAPHPELDEALTALGHGEWAFLTAWNPGSRPCSPAENDRAQQRLRLELAEGGWEALEAVGVAEDASWSEDSLFVPGLPREEAERLGRAHGQVAVLVGRVGGPAELLFCEDTRTKR